MKRSNVRVSAILVCGALSHVHRVAPSRPARHPERRRTTSTDAPPSPTLPPVHMPSSLRPIDAMNQSVASSVPINTRKPVALTTSKGPSSVPVLGHIRETLPMPFILQQPEEQTDNWDDDFEEGISLTKIQGMPHVACVLVGSHKALPST